jgi:tRNA(Ser,Leu) C12 N-acetylase TAN1
LSPSLFVNHWVDKILSTGIKKFPFHFIKEKELLPFSVPSKTLVITPEFFGNYEIITTDGDFVYQAQNYDEAKFFVYSSRERNGKAYLPKEASQIKIIVNLYNKYLDDLLDQIKKDYRKSFPEGKDFQSITGEIFKKLNLIRY